MQPLSQEDYAITFKTLKGARHILVAQHRTIYELEQAVEAGELRTPFDPFPFAVVHASRVTPRDPVMIDEQHLLWRDLAHAIIKPIPTYKRPDGRIVAYRYCSTCAEWVHPDGFYADASRRDGLSYICRDCKKEQERERYQRRKAA